MLLVLCDWDSVYLCANRKSAVFWITNGSAANTALPICSLCLSCLTVEMDSSIHWTQNSFASVKSRTALMVKTVQPFSKSRSCSFFKLAREVSGHTLLTVYSSSRTLYDWGQVHCLLCWVSLFWLTITEYCPNVLQSQEDCDQKPASVSNVDSFPVTALQQHIFSYDDFTATPFTSIFTKVGYRQIHGHCYWLVVTFIEIFSINLLSIWVSVGQIRIGCHKVRSSCSIPSS